MFYHQPIVIRRYESTEISQRFLSRHVQPCVKNKLNKLTYKCIKFCLKSCIECFALHLGKSKSRASHLDCQVTPFSNFTWKLIHGPPTPVVCVRAIPCLCLPCHWICSKYLCVCIAFTQQDISSRRLQGWLLTEDTGGCPQV